MLNWIRCHSVGLLRAFFVFGAMCCLLLAMQNEFLGSRVLTIGISVCFFALAISFLARIAVWLSKKFMSDVYRPMQWDQLTAEQFLSIDTPAKLAFIAQHGGIFAIAFGFGWMFVAMTIFMLGGNQ